MNQYNQDIRAETNWAKRTQLNKQMDIYSTEIKELYDKLDKIHKQIEALKLDNQSLSLIEMSYSQRLKS